MTTGEKIKNLRKSAKLTQLDLAGNKFTKGYISQIENNIVQPTINVLQVIAEKLNKPISYFLEENDPFYLTLEKEFLQGESLFLCGDYQKAVLIFQGIQIKYNYTKHFFLAYALFYEGQCFLKLSQYTQSIDRLLTCTESLIELELFGKLSQAYSYIALSYFNLMEYQQAIEWFFKSLSLINNDNLQMPNEKAKLYLNIATANQNLGRLKTALQFFEHNLIHCQKYGVLDTLLDTHVRMGYILYKLGENQKSKLHLSKAMGINQSLEYDIIKMEIYNVLGMLIAKEGKIAQGIKLIKKSMDLCQSNQWSESYYYNIIDWVTILTEIGSYSEAQEIALKYQSDIRKTNNKQILARFEGQLGKLYFALGDNIASQNFLTRAVEILNQLNIRWEAAEYAQLLADILLYESPERAREYYHLSLAYLSETNS